MKSRVRAMLARPLRLAMAAIAVSVLGVVGTATPAHADEPGLFCTITATGTLSAPSPVQFGQLITVGWNVSGPHCVGPVVFIQGRGFTSSENLGLSGSRQVRAITDGTTLTWTLHLYDLATDSQTPVTLATRTITVQ
jgi:hypothetical protein